MNRYVLHYAAAYVAIRVFAAVIATMLKLKGGFGLSFGSAIGSTVFAAKAFAAHEHRGPSAEEKNIFATRAVVATWIVSAVFAVFIVTAFRLGPALLESMSSGLYFIGVALFLAISVLYYAFIRWTFGWYGERAAGG